MSDDMLALAARVEALDGADYETDLAIATWCYKNGAVAGVNYNPALWLERNGGEFTASIDAAMMMVPPDSWHEIKGPRKYLNIPTPVPNYWSAHLAKWNHEGDAMGWGATPALALCAASLRARASMGGE